MNKKQYAFYSKLIAGIQSHNEKKIEALYLNELEQLLNQISNMYAQYGEEGIVSREVMMKHNRLAKLENEFIERVKVLTRGQVKITKQSIKNVFAESYYYRGYAIETQAGYGFFQSLKDEEIEENIHNDMLAETWEETINTDNNAFIKNVKQVILTGLVGGIGFNQVKKSIEKRVAVARNKAINTAQQETHRVSEDANLRAMKFAQTVGIRIKKRFLATLDSKTRKTHQHLDGQTIDIDDYYVSKSGSKALVPRKFGDPKEDNNCRCVSIAIVEGLEPKVRKARNAANEGTIIKYKDYSEWKKELK